MDRTYPLFTIVVSSLFAVNSALANDGHGLSDKPGQTPPNILFLFADDQRTDTIAAYGNERIQTPNLDRLSRTGMNFRNSYCFGSPHGAVCVPSRAMLHSGRNLFHLKDLNLVGHETLGERLGRSGYQTFGTGKWHNGNSSFVRSFQSGRNLLLGGMANHAEVPIVQFDSATENFSKPKPGENFSSKLFADAAIEFLQDRDSSKPFFCYVAFTAPHDPRMSPGNFNQMYKPEKMPVPKNFLPQHPFDNGDLTVRDEQLAPWPRTREVIQAQTADYYGLISHLDQQVGRIMETLRESGYAENTIVIYAADHGLALGSHGLLGKQSLYDHSMKAPLIVAGPGIVPGDDSSLTYLHDLFPTILEIAQADAPTETDGRSVVPLLKRKAGYTPRDYLFTSYKNTIRAIRDRRWKLIRYPQVDRTQLFDLESDADETNNLIDSVEGEHQAIRIRLQEALVQAQKDAGDTQPLTVDKPAKAEIDLTDHPRKPDQWQPRWIIEKYFDQ